MVTVSWNPNIKRIQGEIADALGLNLDEEIVFARAMRLQQWLKKQDKGVPLILDDIWDVQRLELKQVGIAIEGDQSIASEEDLGRPLMQNISENGFQKFSAVRFKILLTSTSLEVLIDMKAKEMFNVQLLTDEEAMEWIQKVVDNATNRLGYRQLLTKVVKNCAEPKPITKKEEALKSVYFTIEKSYSMLKNLNCSHFSTLCLAAQGFDIHVSDLLRYNLGLRIASNVSTLEEAKKCLNKFKDAGLLLSSNNNEVVKMHDIVCDVAIWIAFEEKQMFFIEDEICIEEMLKKRKLNNCSAILLPYTIINKLPDNLECLRLKLLVLFNKNPSLEVSDSFFEQMNKLLILDFTVIDFASLPSSFTSLRNLQMLCFDECQLNDITIVGNLKLKSLDLSNCSKLKVILEKNHICPTLFRTTSYAQQLRSMGVEGNASLSELINDKTK
ncbi:disease resistance protein [Gossypium australe]|uniref:Disease resistance protein n=1 Tax=Gossypium australe TaxID=47621 RepID=A0A5B6VUP3_9ROSI|nr:disease resistance protein [Gossypium australe]